MTKTNQVTYLSFGILKIRQWIQYRKKHNTAAVHVTCNEKFCRAYVPILIRTAIDYHVIKTYVGSEHSLCPLLLTAASSEHIHSTSSETPHISCTLKRFLHIYNVFLTSKRTSLSKCSSLYNFSCTNSYERSDDGRNMQP